MDTETKGLPVAGYRPTQPQDAIELVNEFKHTEERLLRRLDEMAANPDAGKFDKQFLAIGRTQLEQAFMAINRSVFKPTRIVLPGDAASQE